MSHMLRKTLMAASIAAVLATPAWAVEDTPGYQGSQPQQETGQPMDAMPPMDNVPGYTSPGSSGNENPLYSRTPAELKRDEVVDITGSKVGTVKSVVAGQDRASAHAVVSSGGFLGIGASEIVVPLDDMRIKDDKLQVVDTRESLQARGQYQPESYIELTPNRPISEFSAFEPLGEPSQSDFMPETR